MSRVQWDATHSAVSGFEKGTSYGPELPGRQPTYGDVYDLAGRIKGYTIYSDKRLARGAALSIAYAELPTDATKIRSGLVNGCYTELFSSPAIEAAIYEGAHVEIILPPDDEDLRFYDITINTGPADIFDNAC